MKRHKVTIRIKPEQGPGQGAQLEATILANDALAALVSFRDAAEKMAPPAVTDPDAD